MNPLYNTGIHALSLGARIGALKSEKISKMLRGQAETLAALERRRQEVAPDGFDVWFHAASLGEFEQARPIIERLRREHPDKKLLLTFFSPSGYEIRRNYDCVDSVAYLPFDTPRRVRAFLDAARPKMAIFAKYEFWGNYLEELNRRKVPTYIISSIFRKGQRFFVPWGGMFRKMLGFYDHLYVQDDNSRRLLAGIGINNVTVAGDTRFDRVTDIMNKSHKVAEIERFVENSDFTLVAGSSWPQDEEIYITWLKSRPQVKAIIAPHEFDRARLEALRHRLGESKTRLLSEITGEHPVKPLNDTVKYVIVDCFGLLSSLYRYGDAAIIGGGFGNGIHNLNEAAVYDIPVIFGPNHSKFREASKLLELGGGFCYTDRTSLNKALDRLVDNRDALRAAGKAAGDFIRRSIGATDIIYADLFGDK